MSIREILKASEPLVRTVCEPVAEFDGSVRGLALDLIETLRASPRPGVGLSSNQLGDLRRVFIIDLDAAKPEWQRSFQPMVFVNPEIRKRRGERRGVEGCLSCEPADDRMVFRAKIINWVARDVDGNRISGKMSDFLAAVFQHELDHLNGILIVDKG